MPDYVEIAVNVPQVTGVFHYHLPPDLAGRVSLGCLVVVPFGQREVQGVVIRLIEQPEVPETRPVASLLDPVPALTSLQIRLAEDLALTTLAPLAACISLMLPPGLNQQVDTLFSLASEDIGIQTLADLTDLQNRLLGLLHKRGPLRGRQIDRAIPKLDWRRSADALVRRGLLEKQSTLPPPSVRPKIVRTAQLAVPPAQAERKLDDLGRAGSAARERRRKMLDFLMKNPSEIEVAWIYAECGGGLADLQYLADRGLVRLGETEIWRDPLEEIEFTPSSPPPLTPHQDAALAAILDSMISHSPGKSTRPFLLHGVTGSGKTEIYLRVVDRVIGRGQGAIVLVPEISLTPQTVRRFVSRFPGQVGLIHSRLSPGERYDTWRRARSGELPVIIGPRSALFTPLPDLGLIVVDEFHDDSYFQSEAPPRYHAARAAQIYASIAGIPCVLGSATPDVVTYARALQGKVTRLELPDRILAHREAIRLQETRLGRSARFQPLLGEVETAELPPVRVVDMRQQLLQGNSSIFSLPLQEALRRVLSQDEQGILFINRRGAASYVFCRDCGHALRCPRCDTSLTYHRAGESLRCHHCGYRRKMPKNCPNCGSQRIRRYGTGTERVEEELKQLLPQARSLRWDWETTRQKDAHEIIISHFAHHRADFLIGTQMLAKGLDLPLVTLVGVILADVGLNLPDYRAAERTFQVLAQVAGRAGRSPLGGSVILQTYLPDNYVIQAAAGHDYRTFFEQEMEFRRRLRYPPFTHLVRLEYRHSGKTQAEEEAGRMEKRLKSWLSSDRRPGTDLIGPAPCFYARLAGQYRWQIIIRGPDPASFIRGRDLGPWQVEVDPPSLL
jgi:primosomal protein N' (replication factor Y) (superfamily II helicase)